MQIRQRFTAAGFKLFSHINNGAASKVLDELAGQYEQGLKDNTEQNLEKIIAHAIETTSFYSDYRGVSGIDQLPVISKDMIKKHYDRFLSNAINKKSLKAVNTSGSYGAPMVYLLDKQKSTRRSLEMVYYNGWANYQVGMKHVFNNSLGRKSLLSKLFQNAFTYSFINAEDQWCPDLRRILIEDKVSFYVGFASALETFARYCQQQGDHPELYSLVGMVGTSEPLRQEAASIAESVFGCPVLSRYASEEFGVIAQHCPEKKKHHLNSASYFIELLALDKDEPAQKGEIGRVVVTDLYARGMPLLRYDTGDLAVMAEAECDCGRKGLIFESLEGRLLESLVNEKGKLISGFAVSSIMLDFTSIDRYQFIQKSKNEFILRLVAEIEVKEEKLIVSRIKEMLGQGININVEYCESIPRLKSGKLPFIINEYLKKTSVC